MLYRNKPISQLPYETQAELAFERTEMLDAAVKWCVSNNHKNQFLSDMRNLLTNNHRSRELDNAGFSSALRYGDLKKLIPLEILSPAQALQLLECYYRDQVTNPNRFKMSLFQLEDAIADMQIAKITEKIYKKSTQ